MSILEIKNSSCNDYNPALEFCFKKYYKNFECSESFVNFVRLLFNQQTREQCEDKYALDLFENHFIYYENVFDSSLDDVYEILNLLLFDFDERIESGKLISNDAVFDAVSIFYYLWKNGYYDKRYLLNKFKNESES